MACLPAYSTIASSARMSILSLEYQPLTIFGKFVSLIYGNDDNSFKRDKNKPGIPMPPPAVCLEPAISLTRCPNQFIATFRTSIIPGVYATVLRSFWTGFGNSFPSFSKYFDSATLTNQRKIPDSKTGIQSFASFFVSVSRISRCQ